MEITSALHFDHESLVSREFAALFPLDTFDACDGDTIEHIAAEGNRP